MLYRAIGLMSGSSLDGLDIAFAEFREQGGKWEYELLHTACHPYPASWSDKLKDAINLSARDYLLLHTAYGHYLGQQVNQFIESHQLQYKVALVSSHGHTTFHIPGQGMTGQLGDGAAIAAETKLPIVSDLRALDVAMGGQGAPIVPIGEKLLLSGYNLFLNLGGIANISHNSSSYIAFDICPANRVLNMLIAELGKSYDDEGKIAATGKIDIPLLEKLNSQPYYQASFPKSLANDFGTEVIYPLIKQANLSTPDALATCVEHIAAQVANAAIATGVTSASSMLVTGGGALNTFLIDRIKSNLEPKDITVEVPSRMLIEYKEALIMAFIGVLRWRQEYNVLSSVTGAERNSIGGALWTGQEA